MANSRWLIPREKEIDFWPYRKAAAIICQVREIKSGGLGPDEEIRENRRIILPRPKLPEPLSCSPGCFEVQIDSLKRFQGFVDALLRPSPGSEFGIGD